MRGLFDTKKEHKSIKLVKKLQEEADKEWQQEVIRRKEQELNDEAIAKELQAQLEEEQRQASSPTLPGTPVTRSDNNNPFVPTSSPPPLPTKPRAYNSANNVTGSSSNNAKFSTNSLPTARNSISIKPLYGLSNASSSSSSAQPSLPPRQHQEEKKPVKSYLNSAKRYQPELQFAVASPTPEPSSVFYTKTPVVSNITPLPALNTHEFTPNTPSKPIVMQRVRPTTAPSTVTPTVSNTNTSEPVRNHMSMPVPTDISPYKPVTTNSNNNSAPSSYNSNNRPPAINVTNSQSTAPPPFSTQKSDPIVLPLSQQHQQLPLIPVAPPVTSTPPYNNHHHHNHNEPPAYFHSNNNFNTNPVTSTTATHTSTATAPYHHQQVRQDNASPGVSLPLNPNNLVQNASSYHNQPYPQQSYSPKPPISTSASSSGFQLPPIPVFASSSGNSTNQPTSMPLNKQDRQQHQLQRKNTNPYLQKNKPLFSNSVLSLKPDEEQPKRSDTEEEDDDWDNVPVVTSPTKNRAPTPIPVNATNESDDESEVDYSDMIYDRRNEPEEEINQKEAEAKTDDESDDDDGTWEDPAVDPFADSFAVHLPKASTATSATVTGDIKSPAKMVTSLSSSIQILDPTLAASVSRKKSTNKVAIEEESKKEDKVAEEEEQKDAVTNGPHQYEEKESEEIEVRPPQHGRSQSSLGGFLRPDMATPGPVYQQQHQMSSPATFCNRSQQQTPPVEFDLLGEEEQLKVYPTNILKAGAPPVMSANNPYNKKQQVAVPASDYGYYKDGNDPLSSKSLPNLPSSSTTTAATDAKKDEDQDRHITVASINPGQRVWIRIHPTDTGKLLAERIHIVASYQTRRVTKITTKTGRNIALDNSPLFEDWNEILNFKEGEAWTVDWVPVESPYVDIITDTKEFMKQLKANFRGTSSSSAAAS